MRKMPPAIAAAAGLAAVAALVAPASALDAPIAGCAQRAIGIPYILAPAEYYPVPTDGFAGHVGPGDINGDGWVCVPDADGVIYPKIPILDNQAPLKS